MTKPIRKIRRIRERMTTTIDPDVLDRLRAYSELSGVPMATLIDRSLDQYLKQHETPTRRSDE